MGRFFDNLRKTNGIGKVKELVRRGEELIKSMLKLPVRKNSYDPSLERLRNQLRCPGINYHLEAHRRSQA